MSSLEIDVEGCKGCGLCVDACPRDVLVMTSGKTNDKGYSYVVAENIDYCTGCGRCYDVCPDVCITVGLNSE